VDLEFSPEEVQGLGDIASSSLVTEHEIRGVYERLIKRAVLGARKPDSSFILSFIRRASFRRKSSYREKLLTLLGALKNSLAWTNSLPGRSRDLGRTARYPLPEKAVR
jgi:hypothetical protein